MRLSQQRRSVTEVCSTSVRNSSGLISIRGGNFEVSLEQTAVTQFIKSRVCSFYCPTYNFYLQFLYQAVVLQFIASRFCSFYTYSFYLQFLYSRFQFCSLSCEVSVISTCLYSRWSGHRSRLWPHCSGPQLTACLDVGAGLLH